MVKGIQDAEVKDWSVNDANENGYIKNRPINYKEIDLNLNWNDNGDIFSGDELGEVQLINEHILSLEELFNTTIFVNKNGQQTQYTVIQEVFMTPDQAKERKDELVSSGTYNENSIFIINGTYFQIPSENYSYMIDPGGSNLFLAIFCTQDLFGQGAGTYFFKKDNTYISSLSCTHSEVNIDEKYKKFFKNKNASDVYLLDLEALMGSDDITTIAAALFFDLGKYQQGDILLIPTVLLEMLEGLG